MAPTRVSNVTIPANWADYVIERTAERSDLWRSGIIGDVDIDISRGSSTVNLPFWKDLSGASQPVSASGSGLNVGNMTSGKDIAVVLTRGNAWGLNELAAELSGDDPWGVLLDLVSDWWARDMQATTLAILKGVFESFAAESPTVNTLDISTLSGAAGVIDGEAMLDTQQLLGDQKQRLTAVAMHSQVENKLRKLDLIDYVQESEVGPRLPMYQEKRVIVDDSMPVTGGVYDLYFFGPGAIGFKDDTAASKITAAEVERDAAKGEDSFFSRRHFVLHPRGVAYDGAATEGGPANSVLDDAASWARVYDPKNIRVVRLKAKIAA